MQTVVFTEHFWKSFVSLPDELDVQPSFDRRLKIDLNDWHFTTKEAFDDAVGKPCLKLSSNYDQAVRFATEILNCSVSVILLTVLLIKEHTVGFHILAAVCTLGNKDAFVFRLVFLSFSQGRTGNDELTAFFVLIYTVHESDSPMNFINMRRECLFIVFRLDEVFVLCLHEGLGFPDETIVQVVDVLGDE